MNDDLKSLRIVHVVSTFPPYKGGIGNICYHFTNELLKSGVNVKVVTLKSKNISGIQRHVKRLRPLVSIGNAGWVPQVFWKVLDCDVVHFHYPFIGGESALLIKLVKPRIKIIVSYHMDLHENGLKGLIFKLYQVVVLPLIKLLSDVIVFSSFDYGRSSALAKFLKNNPNRCRELPYGVDGKLFSPGDSIKERLINQKVIFVAALDKAHSFKGLTILLQAFTGVKTGRLIVVGDGDLKWHYQELAIKMKIGDRVTFLGRLNDQDLAQEYKTSKLFVLPSITCSEAFGLVILEALSSGVPTIASNLPGVRAIISDGVDGFLVSPGDVEELREKIRVLLEDYFLNDRFGLAGRRKVLEKYSWSIITQTLLRDIYRLTPQT